MHIPEEVFSFYFITDTNNCEISYQMLIITTLVPKGKC
jgi:hypothetical protein